MPCCAVDRERTVMFYLGFSFRASGRLITGIITKTAQVADRMLGVHWLMEVKGVSQEFPCLLVSDIRIGTSQTAGLAMGGNPVLRLIHGVRARVPPSAIFLYQRRKRASPSKSGGEARQQFTGK